MGVFGSMPSVEVCKERGEGEYSCGENGPCTQSPQGNCKGRCEDEVPRCMEECDCEGDDCPKPWQGLQGRLQREWRLPAARCRQGTTVGGRRWLVQEPVPPLPKLSHLPGWRLLG